ncbi:diacylglycerol kinase [Lentilactobacillus senioris]|uniref:diacylglycerol kinase n=1 Tax=Lentilactobacillus senioris TaxID=931534 RepID=UPI00228135CD|nr:diacylglycerol kinase [Lentilactobacillus senioris]MCY9806677.1 diacylglycerol kinase [Lentilactobacillus senioris]
MQKRARIIYNPTAGRELMKQKMIDILGIFEEAGYETSAFATTPEKNSAKNEAERAAKAGFDLVVAAGGDGTINEVVNGIAPLTYRPKMAIIPAGTTNDYARALHIPREDPVEAAKIVLKDQTVKMDIGQANDNYFINIAAGGKIAELTYEVPSNLKTLFGYLAYLVKGAELLPQVRPVEVDIKYDGGEYKGKASMFFLALTNSVGGLEQIVPDAELDDGKFTMIIVKTANLVEMLHLLSKVLNGGKHVDDPRIIYKKTRKVKVLPINDQIQVNLDGEYGGDAPMTFIDHKRHIEMFANTDKIPNHAIGETQEEKEAEAKFLKGIDKIPDQTE